MATLETWLESEAQFPAKARDRANNFPRSIHEINGSSKQKIQRRNAPLNLLSYIPRLGQCASQKAF